MGKATAASNYTRKINSSRAKKPTKVRFGRNSYRLFCRDEAQMKEDAPKIWYSIEEYRAIHASIHDDLREAAKRGFFKGGFKGRQSELSIRGLEHHLYGNYPNPKRANRKHFARLFLELHKVHGVTCPLELRAFAAARSRHDQARAHHFAMFDAMEAYKVHQESNSVAPPEIFEDYSEFCDVPKARNLSTERRTVAARLA
jgi:hypothetical protein